MRGVTLKKAPAWSYELCNPADRLLIRTLGTNDRDRRRNDTLVAFHVDSYDRIRPACSLRSPRRIVDGVVGTCSESPRSANVLTVNACLC